jgi:hypothetical protein
VNRSAAAYTDALLAVAGLAGAGIIALSFMTWMNVTFRETIQGESLELHASPSGLNVEALTTFGDGYVTAVLGGLIVLFALVCRLGGRWSYPLAIGMGAAAFCAAAIGLYDIAYDRADNTDQYNTEVSRTAALWLILVLGGLASIVSLVLMAIYRGQLPAETEEERNGSQDN